MRYFSEIYRHKIGIGDGETNLLGSVARTWRQPRYHHYGLTEVKMDQERAICGR